MNRRYYELKASIVAIAMVTAALGGGFECSRLIRSHDPNYEAAFVAQAAVRDAALKLRDSLAHLFAQAFAAL